MVYVSACCHWSACSDSPTCALTSRAASRRPPSAPNSCASPPMNSMQNLSAACDVHVHVHACVHVHVQVHVHVHVHVCRSLRAACGWRSKRIAHSSPDQSLRPICRNHSGMAHQPEHYVCLNIMAGRGWRPSSGLELWRCRRVPEGELAEASERLPST